MLNIPGTMLIVRRKQKGKGLPSYIRCYLASELDEVERKKRYFFNTTKVYLFFGDPCLLLNIENFKDRELSVRMNGFKQPKSANAKLLTLLHKNQVIQVITTPSQKWFTYPDVWRKKGYDLLLKKYEKEGIMKNLRQIINK